MVGWASGTSWRQGHLLTQHCLDELKFVYDGFPQPKVLVISHDCDLDRPEEYEPYVEVIVGKAVTQAQGNYIAARNSRTLHLSFDIGRSEKILEFRACDRTRIAKADLAAFQPDASMPLAPRDKRTLQHWLSARYMRPSYPTNFNNRMRDYGLAKPFNKLLNKATKPLAGVYFDLDQNQDNERDDSSAYELDIYLIAAVTDDPSWATNECAKLASEIDKLFRDKCLAGGNWTGVELRNCFVLKKSEATMEFLENVRKWDADYLSLRDGEDAPPA